MSNYISIRTIAHQKLVQYNKLRTTLSGCIFKKNTKDPDL